MALQAKIQHANYNFYQEISSLDESRFPDLVKEFDFEGNAPLTPEQVAPHSDMRLSWKYEKGHKWEAKANDRTRGRGCPYCAGKKPIVGETDLASRFPELLKEFDYERNAPLTPEQITAQSHKRLSWKCEKGHKWKARVSDRARGHGKTMASHQEQWTFPGRVFAELPF